jgi:TonB-linked SusC/RagA family outer membrane protein
MKTKLINLLTLSLMMVFHVTFAQNSVSGVVSDDTGVPLPGATVQVVGTSNGVTTDFDGNYTIMANQGDVISFSFVGFVSQDVTVGTSSSINVQLSPTAALDEVVVTGVAGATSRKKLSVTVASLSADEIEKVPASSASGALLGKVAGVSIANLGNPGGGSTIILRGATNFYGSQEPLVLVDGVTVEGGLDDINVDDIASIEIVKGASAAALYGSRAGNGVVVVTTKRGSKGTSQVTYRSEIGFNKITNFMKTNQTHGWKNAADFDSAKGTYTKLEGIGCPAGFQSVYAAGGAQATTGARIERDDNMSINPFGVYNDFQKAFFREGVMNTNYISASSGNDQVRTLFSFENYTNEGVVKMNEGYKRQSYRANIDFDISEKIKFSASNNFVVVNDRSSTGAWRTATRISPDANVFLDNPDGSPYWYLPDPHESEISNPLYGEWNKNRSISGAKENKFLGGYNLTYQFSSILNLNASYAFESRDYNSISDTPYDSYTTTGDVEGFGYSKGGLSMYNFQDDSQTAAGTLNYAQEFGELDVKGKLNYTVEDRTTQSFQASGNDYLYQGLPTLDNFAPSTVSITSNSTTVRSQNYSAIIGLVFQDKYILDGLWRNDGSSLFGSENKWNSYYRVSGAWRISEDFAIPGVDELKLNVAIGTAGQRPGFNWQYEQTSLSGGSLSSSRLMGNPKLKPSETSETEIGLTASFADSRYTLDAAYSDVSTVDQFMAIGLFAPAMAGKNLQWQNVGDLEATTIEASLRADILRDSEFKWNAGITYTTTDSKIVKLNTAKQQVGVNGLFLLQTDTEFGSMWGRSFVYDLATMAKQLPAGDAIGDYSVNSDGLVVKTANIGTADEAGIIMVDANGTPDFVQIGNQNADFRMGMTHNMTYKKWNLFMLWDMKVGGDIYNQNTQWNTISERAAIVDQTGKAPGDMKTRKYYGSLYDVNQGNKFWVEDGSYTKLRELAVTYDLSSAFNNFAGISSAKVSFIGRNLLTITDYTGWDPEVTSYSGDVGQYFSVDQGVYPTQSTYSVSLNVKF